MPENINIRNFLLLMYLPLTKMSTLQYFAYILFLVLIVYLISCLPTGRAFRSPPRSTEICKSGAFEIAGESFALTSAVAFPGSVLIVNDGGQWTEVEMVSKEEKRVLSEMATWPNMIVRWKIVKSQNIFKSSFNCLFCLLNRCETKSPLQNQAHSNNDVSYNK